MEGIEIYGGVNNVDVSGAAGYRVAGCIFFGAGNSGILAVNVPIGIEEKCEYAANANDGSSPVNGAPTGEQITVIDAWSHDNGDEGHSIHQNCRATYLGGLYEYNANGGITPAIGGSAVILGTYTRGNLSGITPAVIPDVNVLVSGWTSDRDFDGFAQWTGGLITIVDSKILDSLLYSAVGVVATARARLFNTLIRGGLGEWRRGWRGRTELHVRARTRSSRVGCGISWCDDLRCAGFALFRAGRETANRPIWRTQSEWADSGGAGGCIRERRRVEIGRAHV